MSEKNGKCEIAIVCIAFNSAGERYESYHTDPDVKDFIDNPGRINCPSGYVNDGKIFVIDTTDSDCTVVAAESIIVPPDERRDFSYWLIRPNPFSRLNIFTSRELKLHSGWNGWVSLWFGIPPRPIDWKNDDIKLFNLFVHIMMENAPGWEPPEPGPWYHGRK